MKKMIARPWVGVTASVSVHASSAAAARVAWCHRRSKMKNKNKIGAEIKLPPLLHTHFGHKPYSGMELG